MRSCASKPRGMSRFNPRFAPKSEAMLGRITEAAKPVCFNPRFAPKSEAMGLGGGGGAVDEVSIRASLRRAKR